MLNINQGEDEDDDTHMCIKCKITIVGLDNYIKHRKTDCTKLKERNLKNSNSKHENADIVPNLDPLESNSLCADLFFQSLELKSSSKRNVSASTKNDEVEVVPNLDIESTNLGADVFFQSLELKSSCRKNNVNIEIPSSVSKTNVGVVTRRAAAALIIPSTTMSASVTTESRVKTSGHGEEWIGGHSIRLTSNEDNQTRLIKAVANISGNAKKYSIPNSYNLMYDDYKHDDVSNDDTDISDEDDEDDHPITGGKWKPPSSHTGGKWRPGSSENWTSNQIPTEELEHLDDWDIREEHSAGKWKLLLPPQKSNHSKTEIEDDDDYAPPPNHTKGKWVPGEKEFQRMKIMEPTLENKGAVLFWCGPCHRKLGSKQLYDKHLLTNLHLKKISYENDLEFSGHLNKTNRNFETKITKTQYSNDTNFIQEKRTETEKKNLKQVRKKRYIYCPGCNSKVRSHLMGKHLISHFHFRRSVNKNVESYKELILLHIDKVVYQSPFQCSPCKFYTNLKTYFIQHWHSKEHELLIGSFEGRLWCSFCKHECESSSEMLQHIQSKEHEEVIAVINRSMPIIIRKKTLLKCNTCSQCFRYNIQLKYHSKLSGHQLADTASDTYQGREICNVCNVSYKSSVSLAAHLKKDHKRRDFFCLICSLSFKSSSAAKAHRKKTEHKIKRSLKAAVSGKNIELSRKCCYCDIKSFENIIALKCHIETAHPEMKPNCTKCGKTFTLPQEVTQHIKSNACEWSHELDSIRKWHCSQCLFQTDSKADCYYHEVLHTNPIQCYYRNFKGEEKAITKYKCPLCNKLFRKSSLRPHLRQHTSEKTYKCNSVECRAEFTRYSSVINHKKAFHCKKDMNIITLKYICDICHAGFKYRHSLQRHAKTHTVTELLPCKYDDCVHKARTNSELNQHIISVHTNIKHFICKVDGCDYKSKTKRQLTRHQKIHTSRELNHKCPHCNFKSDQSSHLKRHLRLHEGVKPYQCPHCNFFCACLENLRKHCLKSMKHPGKYLYECKKCTSNEQFATNLASEFRGHLVGKHSDKFDRKNVVKYVAEYCMRKTTVESFNSENHQGFIKTDMRNILNLAIPNSIELIQKNCDIRGYYNVVGNGNLEPYTKTH